MKIILIRHAKVDMKWNRHYHSSSFDNACSLYDTSKITKLNRVKRSSIEKIYISDLSRTYETAVQLFGNKDFKKLELINEVPLRSFTDTKRSLPCFIWMALGRMQWWMENKRQPETKSETIHRAKQVVSMLIHENEDCYIITHGLFIKVLLKELRRAGFQISKNKLKWENLDEIIAMNGGYDGF